ncbi:MAG TPA: lysophospholipid acyltransferase family protein [Micromonosporaceae bacterium]|nr:lysophospholipid acyltransferase family protein [Micromonosporaceae bacterium]
MLYWLLKYVLVGPAMRVLFRPQVSGAGHVPASGPVILAANHLSFMDSIVLPLAVRRRVTFPAKIEYFRGRGLRGVIVRLFFAGTGQVPLDRSGGRSALASLDSGADILRAGGVFGIYPEGTRSPDGRLHRGKVGVARLALTTGASVVPVALLNLDEIQPPGHRLPRIRRVRICFGEPLDFSRYAGLQRDRHIARAVTDEIMYEIMRLSGREYVDVYAQRVKSPAALRTAA